MKTFNSNLMLSLAASLVFWGLGLQLKRGCRRGQSEGSLWNWWRGSSKAGRADRQIRLRVFLLPSIAKQE